MDSYSPESDVYSGFEGLLMHRNLFQVVQSLPSINHPEIEGENSMVEAKGMSSVLLSNDGVLHVQVGLLGVCDEELGGIGVWSTVSHGNHASCIVLEMGREGIWSWSKARIILGSMDHSALGRLQY